MKIAVIGASGILGRELLPLLISYGYEIHALAPSEERIRQLYGERVSSFECDLISSRAEDQLRRGLSGCDAVIHIATSIPRDFKKPGAWDINNRIRTDGVRLALKVSLQLAVKRYLQQSITMAYPDCGQQWINENTPLDNSPERAEICAAVIEMERMIKNTPAEKLHCCILRGGEFVGPGTFQELIIKNLKAGKQAIQGNGNNFLSMIHVSDMAAAFMAALVKAPAASIFNIVDNPIRQGEYLQQLAMRTDAPIPQYDSSVQQMPSWRCSNQAALDILDWKPQNGIIPGKSIMDNIQ